MGKFDKLEAGTVVGTRTGREYRIGEQVMAGQWRAEVTDKYTRENPGAGARLRLLVPLMTGPHPFATLAASTPAGAEGTLTEVCHASGTMRVDLGGGLAGTVSADAAKREWERAD